MHPGTGRQPPGSCGRPRRRRPPRSHRRARPVPETPRACDPGGRIRLLVLARQVEIIDVDVDLDDVQARHALHGLLDVALDAPAQVGDADAVLHDDVQVNGRLGLADLDPDTLSDIRPRASGGPLPDRAERAAGRDAHGMHAADFPAGDAGDLLDDALGHGDLAAIARTAPDLGHADIAGN